MEDSETIAVTPAITISTLSSMISVTSQNSVDLLTSVSTMDSNSMINTSSTDQDDPIIITVPSSTNIRKYNGENFLCQKIF